MSKPFWNYLAAMLFLIVAHDLATELTERRGDIVLTMIFLALSACSYLGYLYASRDRNNYPSTIRAKLNEGYRRGSSGERG